MTGYHDPLADIVGAWVANAGIEAAIFRLALALVLGAIIGWERSSKRHSAGFRTFILVIISGVFVILLEGYIDTGVINRLHLLPAAFLLAISSISINSMHYSSRNEIKGLTTAIALWTNGLIGLMIGSGMYTIAVLAFMVLMCALFWFPALETYLKNRSNHFEIHLELTNSVYLQDFVTTIRRLGLFIDEIEMNPAYAGSGLSVYSISISISSDELKKYKSHAEIIKALGTLDYIYHIEEMV